MDQEEIFKIAKFFETDPVFFNDDDTLTNEQWEMVFNLRRLLKDEGNPHYESIKTLLQIAAENPSH
jgi:hypothetical protein